MIHPTKQFKYIIAATVQPSPTTLMVYGTSCTAICYYNGCQLMFGQKFECLSFTRKSA